MRTSKLPPLGRLLAAGMLVAAGLVLAGTPHAPMTLQEYRGVQHERPYVLSLRTSAGELNYYGVSHTRDPAADAINLVRAGMELSPAVVYVEGPVREPKPTLEESVRSFGEAGAATFLARQSNVRVSSLDLPFAEEIATVRGRYSAEMAAAFYGLRAVLQERARQPELDRDAFLRNRVVPWLVRNGALPPATSPSDFHRYLQRAAARPDAWTEATLKWFDPLSGETMFNQVAKFLVEQRDRSMVSLLAEEVRRGRRVMAVAGASHVVMQEPAIRGLLGCPPIPNRPVLSSPSTAACH